MARRETPHSRAKRFFHKHAGYGYTPGKETERQGRNRGAAALAKAEAEARSRGWYVKWEHDPEPWDPGDTDYEPREVLVAVLYAADGKVLGSLGGNADVSNQQARVIEAELALEALK